MNGADVTWETLDWTALDRLRTAFLLGRPGGADYWTSTRDVANYDLTFAQRIGWKWDAVLRELGQRGWTPPPGLPVLDWGCGSGVAGRRVVEFFGPAAFERMHVSDRSPCAREYAVAAGRRAFPELRIDAVDPQELSQLESVGLLVISHVLNELDAQGGAALRQLIDRAAAVLWVEPGTHADSHALVAMRETLREQFLLLAPCTHQGPCGLRAPGNERHWCHHFAAPPPGIMGHAGWVRFAQRAGIDLRSLPHSFLALERRGERESVPGLVAEGWSRRIGEARVYKGFAKILLCQADGVADLELQKRDAPGLFKQLKDGDADTIQRWTIDGRRVRPAPPEE